MTGQQHGPYPGGTQECPLSLIDIRCRNAPGKQPHVRSCAGVSGIARRMRRNALGRQPHIRRKSIHKKIIRGSAASLLGLSITLAGLFPSPVELVQQQTIRQLENPAPVEMMLEEELPDKQEEDRRKSRASASGPLRLVWLRQALQRAVLRLPVWVRICFALPLWAAGTLVLRLLSGFYQAILAPVASHVAGFILCAVLLLASFVLTMKCVFPRMPLKKILRRKNIRNVLIGAAVLKLLDLLLPVFWEGYGRFKYLLLMAGGIVVLGLLVLPKVRRYRRKRQRNLRTPDSIKTRNSSGSAKTEDTFLTGTSP